METPNKLKFQIDAIVPHGKTPQEAVEWVQKFFDFYHPRLEAVVSLEGQPVKLPNSKKK